MIRDLSSGFRVSGFGYRNSEFRFRVSSSGFRVSDPGFRVSEFCRFRVPDFGFQILGFGFWVSEFRFRVSSSGCRVLGFEFRVPGSGIREETDRVFEHGRKLGLDGNALQIPGNGNQNLTNSHLPKVTNPHLPLGSSRKGTHSAPVLAPVSSQRLWRDDKRERLLY